MKWIYWTPDSAHWFPAGIRKALLKILNKTTISNRTDTETVEILPKVDSIIVLKKLVNLINDLWRGNKNWFLELYCANSLFQIRIIVQSRLLRRSNRLVRFRFVRSWLVKKIIQFYKIDAN